MSQVKYFVEKITDCLLLDFKGNECIYRIAYQTYYTNENRRDKIHTLAYKTLKKASLKVDIFIDT